ncbi:HTH-type transcriptional regulator RutR [Paracoccaceae bacterium]
MTAPSRREQNRAARTQRILEAALKVFAATGYTGTTMDAVAAEAGLTKPTLYQYFASKELLFQAMMSGKRDAMLMVFAHPQPGAMVRELLEFSWDYAATVMRPDMLSLARLIIGEVQRFPDLGRAYQASGPDDLLRGIMGYLEARRGEGLLCFDDAELAAQDLWGLILSAPRTQALYMPMELPDRATLARYIHNGLRVFLRAYSTRPEADLATLEALLNGAPSNR